MDTKGERIGRREMIKRTAVGGLAAATVGLLGGVPQAMARRTEGLIHGTCFLGGKNCKVVYVDLGIIEGKTNGVPIYSFPASDTNPLDTGGNYRPERLQNNAFAGGGKNWLMFDVVSGTTDLFASTDGTKTIYSIRRAPTGSPSRDLTLHPFKSEEEILMSYQLGEVQVVPLGVVVDCPVTDPNPGDIVVDLNPTVGPFCNKVNI